ncbi:hypothetical protein [Sphingobium lactosutens]|uniref:hypothetical protein n=1 Tax=Sphingobium lactosutens TaxID=522773 RepID=UPI0012684F50|nr:hypothetical protein [Sphingobium lactosutens]
MGVYVNQKCGGCKKSLTSGYVREYSGIGQPFVKCHRCGILNNNSDRVTEWDLKSGFGKAWFVFSHFMSVLFYYGGGAFLIGAVLLGADVIDGVGLYALLAVLPVFGLIRFSFQLCGAIEASRVRMRDVDYVAQLRHLGYAPLT